VFDAAAHVAPLPRSLETESYETWGLPDLACRGSGKSGL
jgi:hypothetical protein